jgi:hypothetical protein
LHNTIAYHPYLFCWSRGWGDEGEKRLLTSDAMNSKVYVSFGGLLLYLEGPYKKLTPLRIDYVYLLIKK